MRIEQNRRRKGHTTLVVGFHIVVSMTSLHIQWLVLIIRPPMVLVEWGLNREQASLPWKAHFGTKTSCLHSDGGFNL